MKVISLDTETDGIDFRHGALPFFVTTCSDEGDLNYWEWDVDPLTRKPIVPLEDLSEILELIQSADKLVLQNSKFDHAALTFLMRYLEPNLIEAGWSNTEFDYYWDWSKVEDTLIAGHLLASNQPHDLTSMCLQYLGYDIEPYEKRLEEAVNKARRVCRSKLPNWLIARKDLPCMPSAKEKTWKFDTWLPKAVCDYADRLYRVSKKTFKESDWWGEYVKQDHPWRIVLAEYSNSDSSATIVLWKEMERLLKERKYWKVYRCTMEVPRIPAIMEDYGMTVNGENLAVMENKYRVESEEAGTKCINIASTYTDPETNEPYSLDLPKSGNNGSLNRFLFDVMKLPVLAKTETGKPALDKNTIEAYTKTLPKNSKQLTFIRALKGKRKRDTALNYIEGYRRFWIPIEVKPTYTIISGGQNGVDQAALRAAKQLGYQTGGTAPKGFRTLNGPMPSLKTLYGLKESHSSDYPIRTRQNIQESDLTVILYENYNSPGEILTRKACKEYNKPSIEIPLKNPPQLSDIVKLIKGYSPKIINFAGNSEQTCKGIGERAYDYLLVLLRELLYGDWFRLHPNLHMTGTNTLRWSSSNPNEQNIGKGGVDENDELSLRFAFGPAPGREWYSLDARGIEDRLPAYKSKQQELIEIFEKPNEPPYYGSNHFLRFHTVYPDIWEQAVAEVGLDKAGPYVKKIYASTYYQWVKNGGFAVQYGSIDKADGTGTADRAFHRKGCHALLKKRFSKLEALNQWCIQTAEKLGYIETIPDITVDPERGYPLMCTRTEWGRILPTVPLNYYIQGTACYWMRKAMIRCQAQLDQWNKNLDKDEKFFMIAQIHDELLFDFPKSKVDPREDTVKGYGPSNRWRIEIIRKLMEEGGNDIGIPTPVSLEYHPNNWGKGYTL